MRRMQKSVRSGHTLIEVLIASSLSVLVMAGAFGAYSVMRRSVAAGTSQVIFNSKAREVAQKIVARVEEGRTVSIGSVGLDIVTVDLKCSRIYVSDIDGNPATVEDNFLMYDPDTDIDGDEQVYCRNVRAIEGESMFSIVPSTPSSARIRFHIGDGTNTEYKSFSGTGEGYQGIEVRVSATPRNLQRWYD